jgi:hypothetical protein
MEVTEGQEGIMKETVMPDQPTGEEEEALISQMPQIITGVMVRQVW